ncbi:hypothetical protein ElyMa_003292300 [Elysia marginata]|uniref:Uncharacterized protein n=1 Tax=Elysia marginata TaxID=1093978 RepID=A0AAV4JDJ1_9GAST|nr:hypothetical protein ElyMa_003292300 [Elysia marginata]
MLLLPNDAVPETITSPLDLSQKLSQGFLSDTLPINNVIIFPETSRLSGSRGPWGRVSESEVPSKAESQSPRSLARPSLRVQSSEQGRVSESEVPSRLVAAHEALLRKLPLTRILYAPLTHFRENNEIALLLNVSRDSALELCE